MRHHLGRHDRTVEERLAADARQVVPDGGTQEHTGPHDDRIVHRRRIRVDVGREAKDDEGERHPKHGNRGNRFRRLAERPRPGLEVTLVKEQAADGNGVRDVGALDGERKNGIDGGVAGKSKCAEWDRRAANEPDGTDGRAGPLVDVVKVAAEGECAVTRESEGLSLTQLVNYYF